MHIEINRDLDLFKESVFLGLSLRQLIYSILALAAGAGIVLFVYPFVGLTVSAYIAVPVVAPIALTGFYSYHGMTFVEMMRMKLRFAGKRPTLRYESTEDDEELERLLREETELINKQNKKTVADRILQKKHGGNNSDNNTSDRSSEMQNTRSEKRDNKGMKKANKKRKGAGSS